MARRRYYGKRRGGFARRGIGGMKSLLPPLVSGVADSILDPMLPINGVGATAIGFVMHDTTMKSLGLYKVGLSLGEILPLPFKGGTSGGGF